LSFFFVVFFYFNHFAWVRSAVKQAGRQPADRVSCAELRILSHEMPQRPGAGSNRRHHEEAPSRTALLRIALAIGRQQARDAPAFAPVITAKTLAACIDPPTLALGVISAPKNVDRRARMRASRDLLLRDDPCSATLTFILGHRSMLTDQEAGVLDDEHAVYGDIALLDAHDGTKSGVSHGGRAVAEKALAWFVHSVSAHRAPFTCKLDDDTLPQLPNLVADLKAMQSEVPQPLSAYYGVQVYRMWDWSKVDAGGDPNAACGPHGDDGPPQRSATLLKHYRHARPGGRCEKATGPYMFPDGSLEIIGREALVSIFNSTRVRAYATRHFRNEQPPIWTHEDAALGAMVHREVVKRKLPITYVAMPRWERNVFWVNWAEERTLIHGNVLWAHYTRSAERSDYVTGAYLGTSGVERDPFECVDCKAAWGWTPPHPAVACCSKKSPPVRKPPPTAGDERPAACGLGESKALLQLGLFSPYADVDERYKLRAALAEMQPARRPSESQAAIPLVESCFILGIKPRSNPTSPFNVRAWLYYEAGRRGDVDLSPLEAGGGTWPIRGHYSMSWWQRAVQHAAGPHPARFYALGLVDVLLALPRHELVTILTPLFVAAPPPAMLVANRTRGVAVYRAQDMQATLKGDGGDGLHGLARREAPGGLRAIFGRLV